MKKKESEQAGKEPKDKFKKRMKDFGWTIFLTSLYILFSKIGFQLAFLNSQVSPVWPPEGMGLTALLILGPRALPGLFFGAVISNYLNNPHLPAAFLIGIGNTLSSTINYYLIMRFTGGYDPLYSTRSLVYFFTLCTIPGSAVSAAIGVTSLLIFNFLTVDVYWNVLSTWFSGEMQGFLIVCPLLYVWFNPYRKIPFGILKKLELAVLTFLVYLSGRIAFSEELPLLFLPIPFVILTSLRFREWGATISSAALTFTAVTQTVAGFGVFAMKKAGVLSINDSLIYLDAFLFSINGISYFLVTVSRERERAQREALASLQTINRIREAANEELEKKVQARTEVIEKQKAEIDKQLDIAKRIQESLFPHGFGALEELELSFKNVPMMKVGGDLVDVVLEPEKRELGVFICDVSGHGIPAAFLSALVKMSLDEWHQNPKKLTECMERVGEQIRPNLKGHFVTASVIHIDLNTGLLHFARAGHFPLFIIRESGSLITLKPNGRIITTFFQTEAETESFQLQKNDLIILLTDGLTEARTINNTKMFGEERLIELITEIRHLPLEQIKEKIFDEVIEYSGGISLIQDDLTLVLLRYRK